MNLAKVEKFSLQTIADFLNRSDLFAARSVLSFAVGSVLDVTGKIQKVVKRDGKLKLVIEPDGINSFVIFADCLCVAENLRKPQIRKVQRWRSGEIAVIRQTVGLFISLPVPQEKLKQIETEKENKNLREHQIRILVENCIRAGNIKSLIKRGALWIL